MDLFKSYKLIPTDDGYDLILYMDSPMNDTEFAEEFNRIDEDNKQRLNVNMRDYIREKFPNVRINTVKLMVGSILLSSFLMAAPVTAQASATAETTATQVQYNYDYSARISLNGQLQTFKHGPFYYNDTTYVSLSEFGNKIGASVWWNDTSNTVGINKNDQQIAFKRGATVARVNGVQVSMPVSLVVDGVTYAPLRFIAENLGYQVTMNSATGTAMVSNQAIPNTNAYTVVAGDTLWGIARRFNISVDELKSMNGLTGDTIYVGQRLVLSISYTVKAGDTLWGIAQRYNTTVTDIKRINNLTTDTIYVGQILAIRGAATTAPAPAPTPAPAPAPEAPGTVTEWPAVTYIVQPGDTSYSIGNKFGVPPQDIMRYNYMDSNQWFEAGDRIAISGYAPRTYTVTPGQDNAPLRKGTLVDWVTEGQYLVKRNDTFTIVDVATGKQFKATMIGGYNHIDIEPTSSADTQVMKELFTTWKWSPRAVVIYKDGMNIAASLSGMPHGVDTIDNGVSGHFDVYLKNSKSHSSDTSAIYIQEHQNMVLKAAGM